MESTVSYTDSSSYDSYFTEGNTFASVEAAEGASADGYTAYTITGTLTDAAEGENS